MAYIRIFIGLLGAAVVLSGNAGGQGQLDLKDPKVRKMIQEERKSMDCAGIYQQTKLKLDAQFKLGNKLDASTGLGSQLMATLTEVTTALGQSRRELCEFYKHDPEFTKEDYFRAVGELNKGESDAALLLKYASGKASEGDLNTLKTVKPQASSSGSIDVNATMKEVQQTVDSVTARVTKAEQRIGTLESQTTQLSSKADELDPLRQGITTASATVEVIIATADALNSHFMDSGGYLAFTKGQDALMLLTSLDCFAVPQGAGRVMYRGVFTLDATSPIIGKPIGILKTAEYLQIGFKPMKEKQHILGGRAIVTVNNTVRLEFEVPSQDMASNFAIVRDLTSGLRQLK
jgi:hypothetical protein